MNKGTLSRAKNAARSISSFLVPRPLKLSGEAIANNKVVILIPTYKPKVNTYRLINKINYWHPGINIVVIDDSTPSSAANSIEILDQIKKLTQKNENITLLQTPINQLKASALNLGLAHVFTNLKSAEIVITIDDDVVLKSDSITYLVKALFAEEKTGAVCSMAAVKNKNHNLLTRLQGLEYHGFNITRISDNGFLYGPLVMHGMLSAFKIEAIKHVNGFAVDKLIEDFDITVRIKIPGWKTAVAPNSLAWTYVPENIADLWKQRVRWSFGGIIVVRDFWRHTHAVFSDILGHGIFISLFTMVVLSLIITEANPAPNPLITSLFFLALAQFVIGFSFTLITFFTYKDRDKIDWLLKLSIIPEFIYSNLLNLVLIGSYLFFLFTLLSQYLIKHSPFLIKIQIIGEKSFQKLGYSQTWGTRK